MLTRVFVLITLAAILTIGYCSIMPEHSSILLTDVKALTLYKDKYTSARRVEPILQVEFNLNFVNVQKIKLEFLTEII